LLSWVGGVKYGEVKKFQAIKKITVATPDTTTSTTSSSSTSSSSTNTSSSSSSTSTKPKTTTSTSSSSSSSAASTSGGLFSLFGGSTTKTATPTSVFNNVDERAGFRLAIDDNKTEIRQGETITIKVRYENNNVKSFSNGTVEIYLPDQLAVTGTNKGIIDKVNNSVVISLRDFPAGAFGTAIVTAQATGKAGDLDQVMTQAGMKIGGVVLKVADIDEYIAGSSSSTLGASASGVGFLPGSLIGWLLLLIILAAIVIIGRRYFVKKDY
jgi:cytoskeletal protein RodZ